MANFLTILLGFLFVMLIIGLVSPKAVIRWGNSPTRSKVLLYWFLSSLVLSILISFLGGNSKGTADKPEQVSIEDLREELESHKNSAKTITKGFVRERLKYPEEADFELLSTTVQYNDSALYNVRGFVTVVNGFGVRSKSSYNCYLKYLGGEDADPNSWQVTALTIE